MSTIDPVKALPGHVHISEREADGTWEDCTFDSGLEFYRDAIDPTRPATHAEAQLIRKASGIPMTGGATIGDFRRGVKARYGKDIPAAISARLILSALKPGYVAIVQGSMAPFGSTHELSKWDRNFDGAHSVWMGRHPDGTLLWCDPLAPTTAAVPVVISTTNVTKFVNGLVGGNAVVAPALRWPQKEIAMPALTSYLPGYTITIKSGSNIRKDPSDNQTPIRTLTKAETWAIIGTVAGEPLAGVSVWYVRWNAGRYEYVNKNGVTAGPTAPAVDDGYTKATQDAAVAKAKADATAAEKERIAVEVGQASADAIRQA